MDWGRRCGNISPNQVTKNSTAERDIILVTIYELCTKNYLNLTYAKINSPTSSGKLSTVLAGAIFNFIGDRFKKILNSVYSTFETVMVNSSLILSTTHSILSPALTSNILAIVEGTLVRTALVLLAPLLIFVFCLNSNTITSIFIINYTYICIDKYIILSIKNIMKKVIFIYYNSQINYHRIISRAATLEYNFRNVILWKKLMNNT